jgi:type VI protein secretion system component VasF
MEASTTSVSRAKSAPGNLSELCEPLFQYICRLNRSARKGGSYELAQVQSELKHIFAEMRSHAAPNPLLLDQFEKIEIVLMFFVDFMIKESALRFAGEWKEFAFERNELAGDEKFFDMLEETLKDRSQQATERLTIFYTCLGLGFSGWYTGQPEYLRRKMKEIAARINTGMEGGDVARICADAYEHVDTRDLVEPPGTKLLGIAIMLIGLIIVLFIGNAYLYHDAATALTNATSAITNNPRVEYDTAEVPPRAAAPGAAKEAK